ncbi:hypothetical protein ACI2LC_01505 [Nonomuraea wenchangensis]|uniref:hypothetical protein n=1 Tax=Nonomuraea wenchangensis TaxID=568860 RepID=UPI0034292B64
MNVIVPAIVWYESNALGLEYGRMGSLKAFSIHYFLNRYHLSPRLSRVEGVPYPREEFRTREEARKRASEIRDEWRKALATPYNGPHRRAAQTPPVKA